jgi:hypothetical protein
VKGRRNVVTHEREEACDDEGFVAAAQKVEVDGFLVEEETEEREDAVYGYHCEDTDNAICSAPGILTSRMCLMNVLLLLIWFEVL